MNLYRSGVSYFLSDILVNMSCVISAMKNEMFVISFVLLIVLPLVVFLSVTVRGIKLQSIYEKCLSDGRY